MHYRNRTPYRQGDVEPAGLYFSYITLTHSLSPSVMPIPEDIPLLQNVLKGRRCAPQLCHCPS